MIAELVKRGYDSDPVKAWKKLQEHGSDDETEVADLVNRWGPLRSRAGLLCFYGVA